MNKIEAAFAEIFANWDIQLPHDAVSQKQSGEIAQRGWWIRYVLREDYLDYYAEHRMTNPRHVRIHSDGRIEHLEAPMDGYVVPGDADESSRLRAEEEFYANNRRIYAKLREKGLVD